MEQEKRLKGTRWQPSHAEQSWAADRQDLHKSISRRWKCNGWKKTPQLFLSPWWTCQPANPFPAIIHLHLLHLLWQHSCLKFFSSFACSVVLLVWVCSARSWMWSGLEQKKSFTPPKQILRRKQQVRKTQNVKFYPLKIVKYPQKVWFVRKCFGLADTTHLCLAALTNYCLQTGSTDAAPAKTSTTKHVKQATA